MPSYLYPFFFPLQWVLQVSGGNILQLSQTVLFSPRGTTELCSGVLQSSDYPTQKAVKIAVIIQKLPPCIVNRAPSSSSSSFFSDLYLCSTDKVLLWLSNLHVLFMRAVSCPFVGAGIFSTSPYHRSISRRPEVNCCRFHRHQCVFPCQWTLHSNIIHTLCFRGQEVTVNYIGKFGIYKVQADGRLWQHLSLSRIYSMQLQVGKLIDGITLSLQDNLFNINFWGVND